MTKTLLKKNKKDKQPTTRDINKLVNFVKDISGHVRTEFVSHYQTAQLGMYSGTIGKGGDYTKQGDALVEQILETAFHEHLALYGITNAFIISEERGQWFANSISQYSDDDIFCIIDPLDGSHNLRRHETPKPHISFCIGCGYVQDLFLQGNFDAVAVGLVEDMFYADQYVGIRGHGSFLNGVTIHGSPLDKLEDSVIGMSLDHKGEKLGKMFDSGMMDILKHTSSQRRLGSTALDLCQVATGDYDAHVSLSGGVKIHDIAAAQLILREAGCVISLREDNSSWRKIDDVVSLLKDYVHGGDASVSSMKFQLVASGNKDIHQKVISLIEA
ncbi:MAG: inositol monophosphatase family protein [Candidatus Magasanikbacteria bacterium]